MKNKLTHFILALSIYYIPFAQSSVDLNTTRVIYHATGNGEDLRVKNNGNTSYLVQSWVDAGISNKNTPFITTPPLFRIDKGNESKISVVYMGEGEPQDRESLYWLNVKSIPAIDESATKNKVIIAVNHRIKLIYRPENLPGEASAAISKLEWNIKSSDMVHVENKSPYYVTLNQLSINGQSIKISLSPDNSTILPFGSADYSAHSQLTNNTKIIWTAVDDNGMQTKDNIKIL